MPKFVVEETTPDVFLTLPEDSVIPVVVEDITERDVPGKDGKEGWVKLNFRFKILDLPNHLVDEFAPLLGSSLFGSVSARLTAHPDNKLRQWAEALLNIGELEAGFALDTDDLVGRSGRAVIGHWTRRSDNSLNHQVVGVLPTAPATVSVGASGTSSYAFDEPPF